MKRVKILKVKHEKTNIKRTANVRAINANDLKLLVQF